MSCVVSRWVSASCFGGAVPVWPHGSPPCGLMWCVLVFCCPVLFSVALCCRLVVCCCALLFACVVACASLSPPPPPRLVFFFLPPSCWFFFPAFPLFFGFLSVVRCGAGFCVSGCRVCRCVLRWCCPCSCSLCGACSPLWRWLVLRCVACCVWVFAVGLGCPLLSPGGSWCRVSVVLSLSGRVACRPVIWCGVSWCLAALCCVLWRCAVVWWCAVVLCCLSASLPVPVVCFLPLRVCCVCSGVSCCAFPVLSALCGAVLRCLLPLRCAVCIVCAVSGAWFCWFLVSLPVVEGPLVALVAWRCHLVLCVGFGARVRSDRRSASSLRCPAPLCCVLWRCAAVWCCAVVPCRLFLFVFFSLLVALAFCFPFWDGRASGGSIWGMLPFAIFRVPFFR